MAIFQISDDQASNGFLSTIRSTANRFIETAGETAGELLPIWSAQQLGLQSRDQLDTPTFRPTGDFRPTQSNTTDTTTQSAERREVSGLGGIRLDTNTLLLIGGGVLLAGVVMRGE